MVNERGIDVHHTTVFRWVQEYGPELDKRCRPHLRPTNDSWRVDETYIEGEMEVSAGQSILMGTLSTFADGETGSAAKRFSGSEGCPHPGTSCHYCGQKCSLSQSYR